MSLEETVRDLIKSADSPLRRHVCDKAKFAFMRKHLPEYEPEDVSIERVEIVGDQAKLYLDATYQHFEWSFNKDELLGIVLTYMLGGELEDAFYDERRWVEAHYTAGSRDDEADENGDTQPTYTKEEVTKLLNPVRPRGNLPLTLTERQHGSADRIKYRSYCWPYRVTTNPWFNLAPLPVKGPDNTKCKDASQSRQWAFDEERNVHYCPGCGLVVRNIQVVPPTPDTTDDIPE